MPLDVAADVIANRPLSSDFNVLALAAPAIAAIAAPGQFVMIKTGAGLDPLLRRPFSVFEVLRDAGGTPTGFTILSKRIGPSTSLIYDARPGQRVACLGPLGRPFTAVDAPTEAWMVAGGVGLAPFAMLAESLRARGVVCTLFYGARRAADLFYLDFFRALDVELVLTTEDGSLRRAGPGRRAARSAAGRAAAFLAGDALCLRPGGHAGGHRARCRRARPAVRGVRRTHHGLRPRRLLQLRRPDARSGRSPASRPIVPFRPGARGRPDRVGLRHAWTSPFESARSSSRTR